MWRCFSRSQRYSKVLRAASSESHCRQKASSDPLHRPRLTVCIEGNIGSGKTTLLEHFSQFPNVEITWEDVDSWCDVEGYNLLQMAYQDSSRWAHLLQTYAQLTFATGHGKGVSDGSKVKLMERSIHSARYCFLENQYRSGIITEAEYLVACYWYRLLTSITDCQADLVVYLRTNPQSCYDRVMGRGRPEEVGLPLQLLQDLHERHEEWLLEERFPTYGPVTVLNANADLPAMLKEYYTLEAFLAGTADKS